MDGGGRANARCTLCPGQCHWSKHVSNGYRFEIYEEKQVRTIKRRYNASVEGKSKVEVMIATMESHLDEIDPQVQLMIRKVQGSLKRLDEIALKPNPLTEVYIDLLIESEKQEVRPGWNTGVKYYQVAKQHAQIAAGVKSMHMDAPQGHDALWQKIRSWTGSS